MPELRYYFGFLPFRSASARIKVSNFLSIQAPFPNTHCVLKSVALHPEDRFPLRVIAESITYVVSIGAKQLLLSLKERAEDKYFLIKQEIERIFTEKKQRYGYRRILLTLRVYWVQSCRLRLYTIYTCFCIVCRILSRNFLANKPFEKLATDVTEFSVCDEKVYLSPIIDLHNNEVISYLFSTSPNLGQKRETLKGLFNKPNERVSKAAERTQYWLKVEIFYSEKFQTVDEFVHCLKKYIYY